MAHQAKIRLADKPASAATARQWLRRELAATSQPLDTSDDIELVVSELVTNAVRAGATHMLVRLDAHDQRATIAVTDDALGTPVLRYPSPESTSGHGLHIVDALAVQWGVRPEGHRKTVWADLPVQLSEAQRFTEPGESRPPSPIS